MLSISNPQRKGIINLQDFVTKSEPVHLEDPGTEEDRYQDELLDDISRVVYSVCSFTSQNGLETRLFLKHYVSKSQPCIQWFGCFVVHLNKTVNSLRPILLKVINGFRQQDNRRSSRVVLKSVELNDMLDVTRRTDIVIDKDEREVYVIMLR